MVGSGLVIYPIKAHERARVCDLIGFLYRFDGRVLHNVAKSTRQCALPLDAVALGICISLHFITLFYLFDCCIRAVDVPYSGVCRYTHLPFYALSTLLYYFQPIPASTIPRFLRFMLQIYAHSAATTSSPRRPDPPHPRCASGHYPHTTRQRLFSLPLCYSYIEPLLKLAASISQPAPSHASQTPSTRMDALAKQTSNATAQRPPSHLASYPAQSRVVVTMIRLKQTRH